MKTMEGEKKERQPFISTAGRPAQLWAVSHGRWDLCCRQTARGAGLPLLRVRGHRWREEVETLAWFLWLICGPSHTAHSGRQHQGIHLLHALFPWSTACKKLFFLLQTVEWLTEGVDDSLGTADSAEVFECWSAGNWPSWLASRPSRMRTIKEKSDKEIRRYQLMAWFIQLARHDRDLLCLSEFSIFKEPLLVF